MEVLNKNLILEIRAELARQKVAHYKLAKVLDVSTVTLYRTLNGQRNFTVDEVLKVSEFLGLSAAELLSRAESKTKETTAA